MKKHNWKLVKYNTFAHDPDRYDWKCKDCDVDYSTYDDSTPPEADSYEYSHNPGIARFLDGCDILCVRRLENDVLACTNCDLCKTPGKKVPGLMNFSKIMVLGESPGKEEGETGQPFVGRAGKLLNNMLKSIALKRDDVAIVNITKCRPPNNRKPTPQEIQCCLPFLHRQIEIIKPKIIVALGNTALEGLTNSGGISKRCGNWETICINGLDIKLMPCFHPSGLLRNPKWKTPAWHAMQKVGEIK